MTSAAAGGSGGVLHGGLAGGYWIVLLAVDSLVMSFVRKKTDVFLPS